MVTNTELSGAKSPLKNDCDQKQNSIAPGNKLYLPPFNPNFSASSSIFFCLFFVSLYAEDEMSHRSGQFWISSMDWKVARSSSRRSAILQIVTQVTWILCVLWLVYSHQRTFANHSHVKCEFANTKKLVKKLARIETSSSCRQQFANLFANCFSAVHTRQLVFANTSLQTKVCCVNAA